MEDKSSIKEIIDYAPLIGKCANKNVIYMCLKCNKCGRFGRKEENNGRRS